MRDSDSNKFVAALAIIATPFALGAFMLAWSPAVQYGLEDPKRDGYVQPRSVYDLVDKTSESTVTVWCEVIKNNGAQGTAWAIELETAVSDIYPTTLITNHHVIEDCIVIGVTTWSSTTQQYNGAVSLDAFCVEILDCEYEYDGEKTWWDYS
jgi:hypothetical protein